MEVLIVILGFLLVFGMSWILTCGLIYLVTLCFGLEFSWLISTGIWLILCFLNPFKQHIHINNKRR